MNKLFIEDLDLKNKKVLVRVDFNVPLDEKGNITSDKRIRESLPTIQYIIKNGGRPILMSHLGRPDGKKIPSMSLKPVAQRLKDLLHADVHMAEDCIGDKVEKLIHSTKSKDIILLENLRFHTEEEDNTQTFSQQLARLGDVYINDAFGTAHRAHASTAGITQFIKPCASGYLMKKELDYLGNAINQPKRPLAAILGGAKISGKIDVIENLLSKVDILIIGGGMVFTFFRAMGLATGNSIVEKDKIPLAKSILEKTKKLKVDFVLSVDCVVAKEFKNDAEQKVVKREAIPDGWEGLDIGPESIKLFKEKLKNAKTVIWNGPLGVFEMDNFSKGTSAIAQLLSEITKQGAISIIGGGDSASAIKKAGLEKAVTHVSTGGGASLEFLEGKKLPGVIALTDK